MTVATAAATLRYGPELRDQILGSFSGRLQPVSLPLTYRLGLLAVAVLMVILPLVYLALIGFAGYGIYYYFTHVPFPTEVRGRGAIFVWGLYLSPLFIGPLLIVFMLKPLFARPARAGALYSLSPKNEPLLFGAAINTLRPLRPAKLETPPAGVEALVAAREAVACAQPEHARRLERHEQAYEQLVGAIQARALVTAGFQIQAKDFGLPRGDEATVEEGFARARERFAATAKQLAPLKKAFADRWTTAVHLLVRSPDLMARVTDAKALVAEARERVQILQVLAKLIGTMTEVRSLRPVIGVLAGALEQIGGSREAVLDPRQAKLQKLLTRVSKALAGMSYPFDYADPEITLESNVVTSPPDFGGLEALFPMSQTALERFHEIYRRLWGRLAWIAEQVENAAGLEPLPAPEA